MNQHAGGSAFVEAVPLQIARTLRDRHQNMVGFDRLLEIARTAQPHSIFGKFLNCIPDYTGAVGYDDDISLIEVIV